MATEDTSDTGFALGEGFVGGLAEGGLDLGPLGTTYSELFAEALEDGVITSEERERLEKAADNLGIDRLKLNQLEQAMIAAHEAHHRVKVIEKWEEQEPRSLSPIQVTTKGDPEKAMLLKQIERLNARVHELEAELREARANVNVEVDVTGLADTAEVIEETPEQLRAHIRRDPMNPRWYEQLLGVATRASDEETQFWASQALVTLGAASDAQKRPYERHQQTSLIAPKTSLGQKEWLSELVHPDQESLTGQILGRIAPAVLIGRVTQLKREKKLPAPREENRQDPAQTTVMAVRALGWASAVLGMAPPPVYVEPERSGTYLHIPGVPPHSLVASGALRGKTHTQHAFLAGRHLSYYRQEHFVKTLFSSVSDLEDLFLAALLLGSPTLPIAEHLKQRVLPISKGLEPMLDAAKRDALRSDFRHFVAEGGRTNLMRWSSSVDKTASRAGLLLCADLPTAAALLAEEEGPKGPLAADLLVFSISEQHRRLRTHLGVGLAN